MLRAWSGNSSGPIQFNAAAVSPRQPQTYASQTPYNLPDYSSSKVAPLVPILTQCTLFIQPCYKPGSSTFSVCLFPRIALWNPYPVSLNVSNIVTSRCNAAENYVFGVTLASSRHDVHSIPGQVPPTPLGGGLCALRHHQRPGEAVVYVRSVIRSAILTMPKPPADAALLAPSKSPCSWRSQRVRLLRRQHADSAFYFAERHHRAARRGHVLRDQPGSPR